MSRCLAIIFLFSCLTVIGGREAYSQTNPPAPPANPATVEQIAKLANLTYASQRAKESVHNNIEMQKKQGSKVFPAAFWDDFEIELAKTDWTKVCIPVYQRYFSIEDADALIAFYSTPAGQKTLELSGVMAQELSEQGRAVGKEIGARVAQKYQKEIEENIKKQQATNNVIASPQK